MTKPDLSWPATRRELRVTVHPPEDGAVDERGRQLHSVDLIYRCEPATAAESGVPENGWAYEQVEVFEVFQGLPRRLAAVYDVNALNSPLGQVPDFVYTLLREHEPAAIGELEASAEDAWRNVHELQRDLDSVQQRLAVAELGKASVASAAVDTGTLSAGVRGALRMLHDEASGAVSRGLTQAYAVGLAEGEARARVSGEDIQRLAVEQMGQEEPG